MPFNLFELPSLPGLLGGVTAGWTVYQTPPTAASAGGTGIAPALTYATAMGVLDPFAAAASFCLEIP
jgi:hypothetical protein